MKSTRTILAHCLLVGAATAAPVALGQTSGNWAVNNSGLWSAPGNWSSNPTVPGGVGTTIGLNNNIGTSNRTVTIDTTPRTAGTLTIGDSDNTHAFILAASGGGTLTLDNSASGAQITESGGLNDTITTPLALADGLSASVAGSLTISGNISETGGARSITKTGAGTLFLSGNNTYTGNMTIIAGPVSISSGNALGTTAGITSLTANGTSTGPRLLVNGGITSGERILIGGVTESSGFNAAVFNQSSNNTLSGNITLTGATGAIRIGAADGTQLTLSGTVAQQTTTHQLTFQAQGNSTIVVSNSIANNGGGLNVYGLTTAGGGVVRLDGVSGTGIGTTTIQQRGTLRIGVSNAINTTANLVIGSGGTTSGGDVGTLDLRSFDVTVNALVGNFNSSNASTDANRIVTSLATVAGPTVTLTVGNGNGTGTFNGVILNGSMRNVALTKVGTGSQTLAGNNTYSGNTTISGGTLSLGVNGSIDSTSVIALAGGSLNVAAKAGGYSTANLTGSGAVIGSLTVTNSLGIGSSPGTINFENLTLGSSSTYAYEVTGGNTTADLGNVSGTLGLGNATLSMSQLGTYTIGDKFTLFGYTTGNLTGTFNGLSQNATFTAAGGDWQINYADSSSGLNGGTGTSFVTVMAVPEPRTFLMMAFGTIGLALLRRRMRS